jgi:hypothetical protein
LWTLKSGNIERQRCHSERDSTRKVREGVQAESDKTGSKGGIILGGGASAVITDIDTDELSQSCSSRETGRRVGKNSRPLTEVEMELAVTARPGGAWYPCWYLPDQTHPEEAWPTLQTEEEI